MKISINQTGGFRYNRKFVNKLFKVIARAMPRFASNEVSIAFVDNRTIKRLNKKYRRLDSITDVLSFAEITKPGLIKRGMYLGEIIIAYPYARTKAKQHRHNLRRELAILLIHGFLHLVGFDHLNKKDEQKMKHQTETIINKL